VLSSVFNGNRASKRATDPEGGGGAFYNATGDARFVQCNFIGNLADGISGANTYAGINGGSGLGGALYVAGGNVWLSETLLSSNSTSGGHGGSYEAGHFGGSGGAALGSGIYLAGGRLALTNCSLVGNFGKGGTSTVGTRNLAAGGPAIGGGLFAFDGDVSAVNCTFSGNQIFGGVSSGGGYGQGPVGGVDSSGGAIAVTAGRVSLVNCTVTKNIAYGGQLGGNDPNPGQGVGGGIRSCYYGTGTVALLNTILAGNLGATLGTNALAPNDLVGCSVSLGHNLIGVLTDSSNLLSSDRLGLDVLLGPLQDNGGFTPTHALLAGSPAD
jgi:hypothetical protein